MTEAESAARVLLVCLALSGPVPSFAQGRSAGARVDFAQADLMLDVLRSASRGPLSAKEIDAVLEARGTALIVAQQNISRAVSIDQYRLLLQALHRTDPPAIPPVDDGERARRGVDGLRNDVWPGLRWGVANVDTLRRRVEQLKSLDLARTADTTARSLLPEAVSIDANLHVVAGGRAGASVVQNNELYVDVLALSFAAERSSTNYSPDPAFITHEMHHIGLADIIDRAWASVRGDAATARAFGVVRFLALEGSATYLINAHRNMSELGDMSPSSGLLQALESILASALDAGTDAEAFEKAMTPMVAGGFHFVGAVMFGTIERGGGLPAVMEVLRDPRRLLVAYNAAVARIGAGATRAIDPELARRVLALGQ
jgi:hypothetical protein